MFEGDSFLLPPREAGEPIWPEVAAAHERRLVDAQRAAGAPEGEGEEGKAAKEEGVGDVDTAVEHAPRKVALV